MHTHLECVCAAGCSVTASPDRQVPGADPGQYELLHATKNLNAPSSHVTLFFIFFIFFLFQVTSVHHCSSLAADSRDTYILSLLVLLHFPRKVARTVPLSS